MKHGWISLHRKIWESPLLTRGRIYSRFEAFIYMLFRANYKDSKVVIGNQVLVAKKGSFITSQKKLQKEFRWSSSKLRNNLKMWKEDGMIEVETDSIKTQITICKYREFQDLENAKEMQTEQEPNKSRIKKKTENTINKDNKEIRETKFNNKVCAEGLKITPTVDPDIIKEFCNYWTESNLSGTKMKFELQKTFDVGRRLKKWIKNGKDWNLKPKSNISEYRTSTSGHYIGYCDTCNESSFYKEFNLKGDSACCSAKINAKRKI